MVDPEDTQDAPDGTEPEEEGSGPERARPTTDDLQRQLEEVRREAAAFREEAVRGQEWRQLAQQVVQQSVRAVEQPEPEPDIEVDPAVREYLDRKLQAYIGEIGQVYSRDRQQDLSYRVQLERERAATRLVGFNDLAPEIEQTMMNLPPEVRATPGAYEEAYYLTLGRKAAEMLRGGGQRPVGVATSTRSPGDPGRGVGLSDEERAFIQRKLRGVSFDEDDRSFFSKSEFSIEDFNAHAAKRAKGGRKR